ncbi:hypothetical protein [uncultured Alistipes sp.]|uniref:hypothetical protein n=1 Tax=uncultured Alistipes sp. TaxID=538949 RepID=UPI0026079B08|nr:hypothetical protein [uncultured Alistipes sp.]
MKKNCFYAIVIALCGAIGFTSCTKDYDDDLRIQRELIEQNNQELLAMIKAYQVLVENTIEQMDIAYKNADNLIKQEMEAEFNAAKSRLTALETALAAAESNISTLQIDLASFKAAVELDFQQVNTSITAINSRIDDADAKITALDGRLATVETAIADLKAWKILAESKLADLEASQTATAAEIEAMKTRINTAEGKIASLEMLCNDLRAEFQAADLALGARIDDLTSRLGVQETTLTALITSVQTTVTDEINDFKSAMTTAFNDYKAIVDGKLADMASDMAGVITDVNTLTSDLADLSGEVGVLDATVSNLISTVAGLASAADLDTLKKRVDDLVVDLAAKEAALQALIDNNKGNIDLNTAAIGALKDEIKTIKESIIALEASLTNAINEAVADKVTKTVMDAAIDQLDGEYKAADEALQALIDTINNTTIPALESDITDLEARMDDVEADIAAIKNRIQSIQWVHAYADKNLTLVVTEGISEFTAAMLEAEVYVTSNDADIVQKIVDGDVSLEILANKVALTRSIEASPFEAPILSKVDDNVVKITLNWADLTALYTSYSAAVTGDPVDYQLAVKVTDANGNNVVTDFAGIVIKK